MTDKQQPPVPERISPTLCQKCGSVRLHEPRCRNCGAHLFFDDEIPYARVHPVDDARVEEIREQMLQRRSALERDGDDYCIGPSALDDIDYLLSLLPKLSSRDSEPHRCPHFQPKGEDSGGAYNAQIIMDVTNELIDSNDRSRLNDKPTSWYSLLIKQLVQRIANLRAMLARTVSDGKRSCDYRNSECTATGAMVNGAWRCNNHLNNAVSSSERRCAECEHSNVGSSGLCLENLSDLKTVFKPCGCKCVFPATGAAKSDFKVFLAEQMQDPEFRAAYEQISAEEDVKLAATGAGEGERREHELLAAALGVIEQSIRPSVVTEEELRLPKYLARLKHAILAYPPVPVAEGEPPEDPHPGYDCGGTCVIHRTVIIPPPAPTAAPEVEAGQDGPAAKAWREWFRRLGDRATPDVVNATATLVIEERHLLNGAIRKASTVTPGEAAREAARDIAKWMNMMAQLPQGVVEQNATSIEGILRKYFPPTETTQLAVARDYTIRQGDELNGKPLEVILGQLGSPASRHDVERFRCLIEDLRRDAITEALETLKQKEPSQ